MTAGTEGEGGSLPPTSVGSTRIGRGLVRAEEGATVMAVDPLKDIYNVYNSRLEGVKVGRNHQFTFVSKEE